METIRCLNIKCWKHTHRGTHCEHCGEKLHSATAPAYFHALLELEPLRYEYLEKCKRMAYARGFRSYKKREVRKI